MMADIEEIVAEIAKDLPRFSDGRIDYTNAQRAPVINSVVMHGNQILILKRSNQLNFYPGQWSGVSGFIDELRPIEDIVSKELEEEIGVSRNLVTRIGVGKAIEQRSTKHNRVWMIYPILVELKEKPVVRLDREHSDYAWIAPEELEKYKMLPGFSQVVTEALGLR